MYILKRYENIYQLSLLEFLQKCLPESGRSLSLEGRHKIYLDIEHCFADFWCLFENESIIGTVGIQKMTRRECELKSLYLLQEYHSKGLGYALLSHIISQAKGYGYTQMYLDTLSTSVRAISLYKKAGFAVTGRYNQNKTADVFMVLSLADNLPMP